MIDAGLASRFLNRPLALLPADAAMLLEAVQGREKALFVPSANGPSRDRPYALDERGIAVIEVQGVLSHGSAWCWYNETSYESIRACFAHAFGSSDVKAIILHFNSPGGDVAGMLDLADAIYAARGTKPIWAIVDESAYSAAYALASSADRIIVPRTGGVGSIGCIVLHADITGMLEQIGVKVTTVQFGARKSDGYPTTPLTGDALARVQATIDTMGEMFVDLVARNRDLKSAAVRATEAGTFLGADGVAAGLADEVMSPDQAFLALLETLG